MGSLLGASTQLLVPLLLTRAVVGLGDALVWTAGVIYVLQILPRERQSAGVGWFTGALSVGVALAFLVTPLLEGPLGWRGIFAVYGVVGVAVGLAVLAAVRGERPVRMAGAAVALGGVLRERRLLLLAAALFLGMAALYGPLTWIQPFLDEVGGFSSAQRGVAGLLISAAAIPGPILAGIVAGRTGRPVETFAAFLVLSVPVLILALGTERQYVLITLIGALSAFGATGAVTPLFAAVGTVVPPEAAGTAAGIATTIAIAGTVVASYLGGLLVSYGGGYDVAFVVFAALAAAGVVLGVPAARRALRPPAAQP
jgi:predicted MFS family arabinose efflux permease